MDPAIKGTRIVLDCDIGTDDAIALYLLLLAEAQQHIKIEMIICTKGNTSLENASKNTIRMLEIANRTDIPVYKGAHNTLLPSIMEEEHFHGVDGFGDLEYTTEPNTSIVKKESPFDTLKELILNNPNEIVFICIGPLTNLAILLRMYNVGPMIKMIQIMGGNYQGVGNITQSGEFNFFSDPEAAHIVLATAKCPIKLLPWETCAESDIPMKWRMENLSSGAPLWQLIDRAEKSIYKNSDRDNWMPCDAFLIAALLYPKLILKETLWHVDVELAGKLTRGQAVLDHIKTNTPNVVVIQKLNYHRFRQIIMEVHTLL